jgi:hypothetical protein
MAQKSKAKLKRKPVQKVRAKSRAKSKGPKKSATRLKRKASRKRHVKNGRPSGPLNTPAVATASLEARGGNLALQPMTYDDVYYRLEWYFTKNWNPHPPHVVAPKTPIGALLGNLTLPELCENLNRPENRAQFFNNVAIPCNSTGQIKGVNDCTTFVQLLNCIVAAYKRAGIPVSIPTF